MNCKKCGKKTGVNKWEMCSDCRKLTCKKCGDRFEPRYQVSDLCGDCRYRKKLRVQTVSGGIDGE